jgi:hypothetical protein
MRNVMKLVPELSESRGSNFMLFQSWPTFGVDSAHRQPRLDLFTGAWERARPHAPFDINTLSGEAPPPARVAGVLYRYFAGGFRNQK